VPESERARSAGAICTSASAQGCKLRDASALRTTQARDPQAGLDHRQHRTCALAACARGHPPHASAYEFERESLARHAPPAEGDELLPRHFNCASHARIFAQGA